MFILAWIIKALEIIASFYNLIRRLIARFQPSRPR